MSNELIAISIMAELARTLLLARQQNRDITDEELIAAAKGIDDKAREAFEATLQRLENNPSNR